MLELAGEYQRKSWTFFGKVHPERVPVGINSPKIKVTFENLEVEFETFIHNSQIVSHVDILHGDIDIFSLKNLVEDSVRSIVDLISYKMSYGLDVEIISASSRDSDQKQVFGINIPALNDTNTPWELQIDTNLVSSVVSNLPAQIMLADFREAIRSPTWTGFFCYHALEAGMQSMKSDFGDVKDKEAWELFRKNLNVSEETLLSLKTHADDTRHGKQTSKSDSVRTSIFVITNKIIERYLVFLVGDNKQLSQENFPMLVDIAL